MKSDDLKNRFTYHPPTSDEKVENFMTIRESAFSLAILLDELCPDGRELSLAITKLEEVVFWANASIARHEDTSD